MGKVYEGKLDAKGLKICIIVSRFNEFISVRLLEGALDCLKRHGCSENDIDIVWVPGAFEIPAVAVKLANHPKRKYNAIICLGAVIRGATPHFDYIANQVTRGIAQCSFTTGVPTILGVLTTDTIEQAIERAGTKEGNKGWEAALFAIEVANLYTELEK